MLRSPSVLVPPQPPPRRYVPSGLDLTALPALSAFFDELAERTLPAGDLWALEQWLRDWRRPARLITAEPTPPDRAGTRRTHAPYRVAAYLSLPPGNLLILRVTQLYKPARLKRLPPPEDRLIPSPQPAYALHELDLEKWDAQLLPRVDGNRTNAEVFVMAGKPEHQVQAFLVAMVGLSILEPRE